MVRAAVATILTMVIRSLGTAHQASFSDQSMQVVKMEQSLSPLLELLALQLNFKEIRDKNLAPSPAQGIVYLP